MIKYKFRNDDNYWVYVEKIYILKTGYYKIKGGKQK